MYKAISMSGKRASWGEVCMHLCMDKAGFNSLIEHYEKELEAVISGRKTAHLIYLIAAYQHTYQHIQTQNIPRSPPTTSTRFSTLQDLSYKRTDTSATPVSYNQPATMPPIRTSRNRKPPPDGFDDIEDTLLEFSNKMKDAENASHDGKKRHEVLWPIFQISHARMLTLHTICTLLA